MRTSMFLACVIGATGLVAASFGALVLKSTAEEAGRATAFGLKLLVAEHPPQVVNRHIKSDQKRVPNYMGPYLSSDLSRRV